VLTVANFNMHAGVDGWGRPFDAIAVCAAIDADVLVLQEAWTNDAEGPGSGQAEQIGAALGYQVVTCTLAQGRRPLPHPEATARWMPHMGYRAPNRSLYLSGGRPLRATELAAPRYKEGEPGSWGIAVLTRGEWVRDATRTLHLPRLPRDLVRRAAIVVDLTKEGIPFSVVGTHMSHIQYGSHRHYAALRRLLQTEARP
jgi:endonuclease/exonuclease/phosphatase family metal-dependent hydrolase